MRGLAQPDYNNRVISNKGYNNDIISTLNSKFSAAVEQSKDVKFSGNNDTEKARAIWNYLKNNVAYKKDDAGTQVIQLPSRMILDTKAADCKSFGLAAAAFMYGAGIKNVRLRYTSYRSDDPTPSHVYAVATAENGSTIIVDPVYKQFNKELPFQHYKDYPMRISVLSGVEGTSLMKTRRMVSKSAMMKRPGAAVIRAKAILATGKLKPGGVMHNVLSNVIGRSMNVAFPKYNSLQLEAYKKVILQRLSLTQKPFLKNMLLREIYLMKNNTFSGNIVGNLSKSVSDMTGEIGRTGNAVIRAKAALATGKLKPGGVIHNVLTNVIGRSMNVAFPKYDRIQLEAYKKVIVQRILKIKNPFLKSMLEREMYLINKGTFSGNIVGNRSKSISDMTEEIGRISLKKLTKKISIKNIKKLAKKLNPKEILRALKMVGLVVPRKAFLALVALNVRGLAKSLSVFSDDELKKIWVKKFGGELKTLKNTIKKGKNRKALLGASKKVKAIKGIGYVVDDSKGIGLAGEEIAAIVAAAAPILAVVISAIVNKSKGKKAAGDAALLLPQAAKELSAAFPEVANSITPGLPEYIDKGVTAAQNFGIIPDRPLSTNEAAVNANLMPGDDNAPTTTEGGATSFLPKPAILLGAAAVGAFLLLRKKK